MIGPVVAVAFLVVLMAVGVYYEFIYPEHIRLPDSWQDSQETPGWVIGYSHMRHEICCYVGWYIWPTLEEAEKHGTDIIKVRARRGDVLLWGDKYIASTIYVIGEA